MKKLPTLLVLLLAGLPAATPALAAPYGPDDDPDDDDPDEPAREAATLRVPGYQNFFEPGTLAQVYVTFGYGTVDQYYDGDGDLQRLGEGVSIPPLPGEYDLNAEVQTYVVHVGGTYNLSQIGRMKVRAGVDLGLAQRQFTTEETEIEGVPEPIPAQELSSGFAPQNLTIFGEIAEPTYSLRAGYFFDFGPEAEEEDEYDNSDGQNAVLLGISGEYPTRNFRLFAGLDYFLTLKGEREVGDNTIEYDIGDIAVVHGGAGFRLSPSMELGLTLLYRINREGEVGDISGDDIPPTETAGGPNEYASGNSIGLVPYLTYAPVGRPYQVYIKGAVQREYYDYGYTIAGENDIAPRLGFTVGLVYGLTP